MASKKRDPKRAARIELRKLERKERQRSADRERLFATMPAGSRATAMELPSSAVIETRAAAIHCPQCDGRLTIDEHTVDRDSAAALRLVLAHCRSCQTPRRLWFRIARPLAN